MNFEQPHGANDAVVGGKPATGVEGVAGKTPSRNINPELVEDVAYQATLRAELRNKIKKFKVGGGVSFNNPHTNHVEDDWSIESITGKNEKDLFDELKITIKKNGDKRIIKVLDASEIDLIKPLN